MVTSTNTTATEIPILQLAGIEIACKAHLAAPKQRRPIRCPLCHDPKVSIVGTGTLQDDTVTIVGHGGEIHEVRGIEGLESGYCVFTIAACQSGCTFGRSYQYFDGHIYTRIFELGV